MRIAAAVFAALFAVAAAKKKDVDVDVYIWSQCHYSKHFVQSQLYPSHSRLHDRVNLRFNAVGPSQTDQLLNCVVRHTPSYDGRPHEPEAEMLYQRRLEHEHSHDNRIHRARARGQVIHHPQQDDRARQEQQRREQEQREQQRREQEQARKEQEKQRQEGQRQKELAQLKQHKQREQREKEQREQREQREKEQMVQKEKEQREQREKEQREQHQREQAAAARRHHHTSQQRNHPHHAPPTKAPATTPRQRARYTYPTHKPHRPAPMPTAAAADVRELETTLQEQERRREAAKRRYEELLAARKEEARLLEQQQELQRRLEAERRRQKQIADELKKMEKVEEGGVKASIQNNPGVKEAVLETRPLDEELMRRRLEAAREDEAWKRTQLEINRKKERLKAAQVAQVSERAYRNTRSKRSGEEEEEEEKEEKEVEVVYSTPIVADAYVPANETEPIRHRRHNVAFATDYLPIVSCMMGVGSIEGALRKCVADQHQQERLRKCAYTQEGRDLWKQAERRMNQLYPPLTGYPHVVLQGRKMNEADAYLHFHQEVCQHIHPVTFQCIY